jgi:hypothetical protein
MLNEIKVFEVVSESGADVGTRDRVADGEIERHRETGALLLHVVLLGTTEQGRRKCAGMQCSGSALENARVSSFREAASSMAQVFLQ